MKITPGCDVNINDTTYTVEEIVCVGGRLGDARTEVRVTLIPRGQVGRPTTGDWDHASSQVADNHVLVPIESVAQLDTALHTLALPLPCDTMNLAAALALMKRKRDRASLEAIGLRKQTASPHTLPADKLPGHIPTPIADTPASISPLTEHADDVLDAIRRVEVSMHSMTVSRRVLDAQLARTEVAAMRLKSFERVVGDGNSRNMQDTFVRDALNATVAVLVCDADYASAVREVHTALDKLCELSCSV